MFYPVVAEMLLRVLLLAWFKTVAEEVAAPMGAEDVEFYHQPGNLLRHCNRNTIVILRLVAHQSDGALTYINIAHAHARELLGSDAHVMGQITGQQKMPVVLLQVLSNLEHNMIWNDCALFGIALDLNIGEPGTRIQVDIASL